MAGGESRVSLVRAIDQNLTEMFAAFSEHCGGEIVADQIVTVLKTPIGSPLFNAAYHTRASAETIDDLIDRVIASFETHTVPFVFWWVMPDDTPVDLAARLQAHGLVAWDEAAPAMALDLRQLDHSTMPPSGLEITRVRSAEEVDTWARIFVESFEVPPFAGQAWIDATTMAGITSAPWRMFVARLDGVPVAVSLSFPGSRITGIYAIGTIQDARRRGIGAAITHATACDAHDLGYETAMLWASGMGVGVYESLGFQTVGAISRYFWQGDHA